MKIVVDSDIPFINGVLEPWFEVTYSKGSQIDNILAKDATALLVRTRTRCDNALLSGSSVKAIFTATIGMDHIDLDYCISRGIEVFNAAGCNAGGVMQYVITAMFEILKNQGARFNEKRVGIIGAGNVGERVARFLEGTGIEVMRCDPPKSLLCNGIHYYKLDNFASCPFGFHDPKHVRLGFPSKIKTGFLPYKYIKGRGCGRTGFVKTEEQARSFGAGCVGK